MDDDFQRVPWRTSSGEEPGYTFDEENKRPVEKGWIDENGNVLRSYLESEAFFRQLSGDEPLQARANRMTTRDNNLLIRYDGDASAWHLHV